jgi:hypothetical protein
VVRERERRAEYKVLCSQSRTRRLSTTGRDCQIFQSDLATFRSPLRHSISSLFVRRFVTPSRHLSLAVSSLGSRQKKYRTSNGLIRTRQIWTKLWMEQFSEASFRALQGTHQLSPQGPNPESFLLYASIPAEFIFFATHSPVLNHDNISVIWPGFAAR